MKKFLVILFSLVILIAITFSTIGCGSNSEKKPSGQEGSTINAQLPKKGSVTSLNLNDSSATEDMTFTVKSLFRGTKYTGSKTTFYTSPSIAKKGSSYVVLYCDCSLINSYNKISTMDCSYAKLYFGEVDSNAVDAMVKFDTTNGDLLSYTSSEDCKIQGFMVVAEVEDSLFKKFASETMRIKFGFSSFANSGTYVSDFQDVDYAFEFKSRVDNTGENKAVDYIGTKPASVSIGDSITSKDVTFTLDSFILANKISPATGEGTSIKAYNGKRLLSLYGVFKNNSNIEISSDNIYAYYEFSDNEITVYDIKWDVQSMKSSIPANGTYYYYIPIEIEDKLITANSSFKLHIGFNNGMKDKCKNTVNANNHVVINSNLADVVIADDVNIDMMAKTQQKKESIFSQLETALNGAGIKASINKTSGEVTIDSTVLFATDSADVSTEGKKFLNKFMKVYTSVVFADENKEYISNILVAGHTDTQGDYESNLVLSQKRADNVKSYCLSSSSGLSSKYLNLLKPTMTAKGFSYDSPIYDKDGNIDMAASRRVSFVLSIKA